MKKPYKNIIIFIMLIVISVVPFYRVPVVPEWEIQFLNKDGTPASSVTLDHIWKHYSLELGVGENSDLGLKTDSNGYIKLPARQIRVSIFQFVASQIRNVVMSINPHASFGPSSYVVCRGNHKCVVSYKEYTEMPQNFVLW